MLQSEWEADPKGKNGDARNTRNLCESEHTRESCAFCISVGIAAASAACSALGGIYFLPSMST